MREKINEQGVERVLNEENVPDYSFENLKIMMGIKARKITYG